MSNRYPRLTTVHYLDIAKPLLAKRTKLQTIGCKFQGVAKAFDLDVGGWLTRNAKALHSGVNSLAIVTAAGQTNAAWPRST